MKLNATQVNDVLERLEAQVVPADHPLVPQLESIFGPHTFFLGHEGLHVVERPYEEGPSTVIVKVAAWADDNHTSLRPQEAEMTGKLELDQSGPADEPAEPNG